MSTDNYFLRMPQVLEMTGVQAKSTIYKWVNEGKFPAPIKLSPRLSVWKRTDVEEWCEVRGTGKVWRAKCLTK